MNTSTSRHLLQQGFCLWLSLILITPAISVNAIGVQTPQGQSASPTESEKKSVKPATASQTEQEEAAAAIERDIQQALQLLSQTYDLARSIQDPRIRMTHYAVVA